MKETLEIIAICGVSVLLVIFVSLYFTGTKKQKKLKNSIKNLYKYDSIKDFKEIVNKNKKSEDDITEELVEQFRIINAQLELIFELSPVFIVCYDYGRNYFYISENGQNQLEYDPLDSTDETDQKKFESLIHKEDISLYEEITNFEDIRKLKAANSTYIIKIKSVVSNKYGEYLTRVKPIYNEDGINKALIIAFIKAK